MPGESGVGHRLEGRRVYNGVNPATFGVWGLDIVIIANEDEAIGRLGSGRDCGDDVDGRRGTNN